MSDLPENSAPPPTPNYVPALADLHDALADVPEAQQSIGDAAAFINDHEQQRAIAVQGEQAAQNFRDDMTTFRNGMIDYVSNDPTAVHAAMKATLPAVQGTIGTTGHPEADDHVNTVVDEMHRDLATTAITSAANVSTQLARNLRNDPRLTAVLPEDHLSQLDGYIDMQDRARAVDNAAAQTQAARLADTRANHSMFTYAASLFNRDSDNVVFPNRWNQALVADNNVTPQDTATLRSLYARLASGGGAEQSDPFLVGGIVSSIANGTPPAVRDVLAHAATGALNFQHSLHLASLASDQSDAGISHAAGLSGLLDQGRTAIMGDDPVTGARAYSRYVNWLVPQYMQTGPAGADPKGDSYLLRGGMSAFMPTAADLVPTRRPTRPLGEFFSGR